MQDTNEGYPFSVDKDLLNVTKFDEEVTKFFPQEWQNLPKAFSTVYQYDDKDGNRKLSKVRFITKKCEGKEATDAEINALVSSIKSAGEPIAFVVKLCGVDVASFPEGKDPTMREFFEEKFDSSTVSTKKLLISYPFFEEK